jgi:hypothetical protein
MVVSAYLLMSQNMRSTGAALRASRTAQPASAVVALTGRRQMQVAALTVGV